MSPCFQKVSYYSICKKNKGIMLQTKVSGVDLLLKHVTRNNKMNQNNNDMIKTGSKCILHYPLSL